MASAPGFGGVRDEGFQAFRRFLDDGAWKGIAAPDAGMDLDHQTVSQFYKGLLSGGVQAMDLAFVGTEADEKRARDHDWDLEQRRWHNSLERLEMDRDPRKAQAATLLRGLTVLGAGLEQTLLPLPQEVAWGTKQVQLMDPKVNPQAAAAIALLGLEPDIEAIRVTTERLAAAVSPAGQGAPASQYDRLKDARARCITIFTAVLFGLDAALVTATDGPQRQRLEALRAPLAQLLDERRLHPKRGKGHPSATPPA